MESNQTEIGIIYEVIKINATMYVLSPIGTVEGYSVGENFYNEIVHKTAFNVESLQNPECRLRDHNGHDLKPANLPLTDQYLIFPHSL